MAIPMMVGEAQDPVVERVGCCAAQTGILVKVLGEFWLMRDFPGKNLATRGYRVSQCRGCWWELKPDDATLPLTPWEFGRDEQLDEAFRKLGREIAGRRMEEAKSQ